MNQTNEFQDESAEEQKEARFLSSRENRIAISRSATEKRRFQESSRTKKLNGLLDDLKRWKTQLEQIGGEIVTTKGPPNPQCQTHLCPCMTNEISLRLDDVQGMLRELKRQCLVNNDVVSVLHISDLRLLHDQFAICFSLLDEKRGSLLPSRNFLFTRYRAELDRRLQNPVKNQAQTATFQVGESHNGSSDEMQKSLASPIMHGDNIVQGLDNAVITIDRNRITIAGHTQIPSNGFSPSTISTTISDSATSLTLCNIQRSQITFRNRLKSLHLYGVSHCRISQEDKDDDLETSSVVEGAIHVANCRDVDFHGIAAHQLRIHSSADLRFRTNSSVQSGVILEESHGIKFYESPQVRVLWDVKDFGWFQRGRPSPNFEIVLAEHRKEAKMEARIVCRYPNLLNSSDPSAPISGNEQEDG